MIHRQVSARVYTDVCQFLVQTSTLCAQTALLNLSSWYFHLFHVTDDDLFQQMHLPDTFPPIRELKLTELSNQEQPKINN